MSNDFAELLLTMFRSKGAAQTAYPDKVLGYVPTAYYRLNETEGALFNDSSGNDYRGNYYDNPTLAGGTFSNGDLCVQFTGNSVSAWLEGLVLAGQLSWTGTYAYWFKVPTAVANDGTADNWLWLSQSGSQILITKESSTQMRVRINRGVQVDTTFNYTPDEWMFVALTMDDTSAKLYVNGSLNATITGYGTNAPAFDYAASTYTLAYSSTNGYAAHLMYWKDTILTAPQIADLATV